MNKKTPIHYFWFIYESLLCWGSGSASGLGSFFVQVWTGMYNLFGSSHPVHSTDVLEYSDMNKKIKTKEFTKLKNRPEKWETRS